MEAELKRYVRSEGARAIHLRRDDAGMAKALERMRQAEERTRRQGHIDSTGIGLRIVTRA